MEFIRSIILLLLITTGSNTVESACSLTTEGRSPCRGQLVCSKDFLSADTKVREWSCRILEHYTDYNYYPRRTHVRLSDEYTVSVHAENMGDTTSFSQLSEISEHISSISVTNGNISSIPLEIRTLKNVHTIDLAFNSIQFLDLESFRSNSFLVLNVSYNNLFQLENNGALFKSTTLSQLTTIDLSNNAVQVIPNNYFRPFSQLQHLNLSNNAIESIDILTFEGLTQLKTLYMSDNKLSSLGQYFARFVNLQELLLDKNNLTSIENNNFNKMSSLKILNICCNRLIAIDNSSFDNLIALETLDISNNKLNKISKSWFSRNINIHSLDVSNNNINRIEPGAFEGKSITDFNIQNNNLTGCLEKGTFRGINVKELTLSGAYITELGADMFDESNRNLQLLNFSRNSITKVHKSAFSNLELLMTLDLSHNKLQAIEFDMTNLKNLSTFYINDNYIRKITRNVFNNLTALKSIQLTNNDINEIDVLSFDKVSKLESLDLNNNPLPTVIDSQMFSGLTSCVDLDLTYTKITTLHNNSFSGMNSLTTLNISHGDLKLLGFEVFNDTGFINNLDLSHNQIELFMINNSNINFVMTINLGYNKILHISNETFSGLNKLVNLNLENNNMLNIETEAFRTLNNLISLKLSHNKDMSFNSSVFYNITSLQFLYLNNILIPFHFENAINTSITMLDVSSCGITDIYTVLIKRMETIKILKLQSNRIRSIDKFSFDKLERLTWIDLSNNLITKIQPSSFSHCPKLQILKLNNNFLSSLQFGVFDGLSYLRSIDLSNNTLHSLMANIFHSAPRVQVVYVDNNLINEINLSDFGSANVKTVSIGGNMIPCTDLTELKKNNRFNLTVTAKIRKYDTENVNGITCKSSTKLRIIPAVHANDTVVTAALLNTIEEFKVTIERMLSRNESKLNLATNELKNIKTSVEHFEDSFDKSETMQNVSFEKLTRISNISNWYLKNILDTVKQRVFTSELYAKSNTSIKYEDIKRTVLEMFEMEKDSLKTEFKGMFNNWISQNAGGERNHFEPRTAGVGASDVKSALYFIATCLAALLCVMVLVFGYFYFKFRKHHASENLYSSRQPISNAMEME